MIDRVYQTVKIIVNSDGRGNVSPNEFDLILHSVVLEKFEDSFEELNRFLNRQNRGLVNGGLENIPDQIRQKIEHYITPAAPLTYSGSSFTLPSDLHYFDTVFFQEAVIELCHSNKEFDLAKRQDPSEEYPIGLKQGSTLTVFPSTITADVTMSYLRTPLQAKWTYLVVDSVEVFNPGAGDYQDIDAHIGQESTIIIEVLKKFGINLKESDLNQILQQNEALEFNQQNAN
jgi:hypothetical protein